MVLELGAYRVFIGLNAFREPVHGMALDFMPSSRLPQHRTNSEQTQQHCSSRSLTRPPTVTKPALTLTQVSNYRDPCLQPRKVTRQIRGTGVTNIQIAATSACMFASKAAFVHRSGCRHHPVDPSWGKSVMHAGSPEFKAPLTLLVQEERNTGGHRPRTRRWLPQRGQGLKLERSNG